MGFRKVSTPRRRVARHRLYSRQHMHTVVGGLLVRRQLLSVSSVSSLQLLGSSSTCRQPSNARGAYIRLLTDNKHVNSCPSAAKQLPTVKQCGHEVTTCAGPFHRQCRPLPPTAAPTVAPTPAPVTEAPATATPATQTPTPDAAPSGEASFLPTLLVDRGLSWVGAVPAGTAGLRPSAGQHDTAETSCLDQSSAACPEFDPQCKCRS